MFRAGFGLVQVPAPGVRRIREACPPPALLAEYFQVLREFPKTTVRSCGIRWIGLPHSLRQPMRS